MTTAEVRHLRDAYERWKREYLIAAYAANGQNASATARQLGIGRPYFLKLCRIMDIPTRGKTCEG